MTSPRVDTCVQTTEVEDAVILSMNAVLEFRIQLMLHKVLSVFSVYLLWCWTLTEQLDGCIFVKLTNVPRDTNRGPSSQVDLRQALDIIHAVQGSYKLSNARCAKHYARLSVTSPLFLDA